MDGKGAWRDNVFVERLWRSVKYEEVYLHAYDSVSDARASIGRYLDLYNRRRPHSSLDGMTPDQAYFGSTECCQSAWQPNPGRGSTHRSGKTVRTRSSTCFGLGAGASTLDPAGGESPSAATFSIGAGIWWTLSGIIAALAGGYAAGHLAGQPKQSSGGWHRLGSMGARQQSRDRRFADNNSRGDRRRRFAGFLGTVAGGRGAKPGHDRPDRGADRGASAIMQAADPLARASRNRSAMRVVATEPAGAAGTRRIRRRCGRP